MTSPSILKLEMTGGITVAPAGERVGEVVADSMSELDSLVESNILSKGFLRSMRSKLGVWRGVPAGVTGKEKGVLAPVYPKKTLGGTRDRGMPFFL